MIRTKKLSDDEIILAFLNNFVGYSAFERKQLMQEHIRRTLRELGVKERYRIVPDSETGQFSCDDRKRLIRCNPGFIESGPKYPGVYAYLLICHECVHARQNEDIRKIDRGLAEKSSIYLNQMGKVPPANEWATFPSCGYISMKSARLLLKKKNPMGSMLSQIYRLQPTEFEAYAFQYKKAKILDSYVKEHSESLINKNFVSSKLSFEICGFQNMIEDAQKTYEVNFPEETVKNALIELFKGKSPQTYVQVLFQTGAMLTKGLMTQNMENINSILYLADCFSQNIFAQKSNRKAENQTEKEANKEKNAEKQKERTPASKKERFEDFER